MGFFKRLFGNNNNTEPSTPSVSVKLFDENDINELFPLIRNLSWLVANVGSDSSLYITYVDASTSKTGVPVLGIAVNLDDWSSKGNTTNFDSFTQNGISANAAKYLESVPFTVAGDLLSFTFKNTPASPSSLKADMLNEIKIGLSLSRYVKSGVRDVKIEDYTGTIICRVD